MTTATLESLRSALTTSHPTVLDQHGYWRTNLPTFGGVEPADTSGVWSWDADRLLVGTCADDLEIVEREVQS